MAEKDFEELFALFNKHRVRYCIVGSFAVAFYARPRYTKDIDVLIEPSRENSRKVVRALNDFGFKSLKLSDKDFLPDLRSSRSRSTGPREPGLSRPYFPG
jgi:uncharacterized protein involved in exopolysaccharide biosynthesis